MNIWLISQSAGLVLDGLQATSWTPTAAQEASIEARLTALRSGSVSEHVYSPSSGTAKVNVIGALTKRPDPLAWLFGSSGTSYLELEAALKAADSDPNTRDIELYVDSPGGHVSGLFEAIAAIQATKKPIRVVAANAASAAYALAASAGPIEATSAGASFGSLGVIGTFRVNPGITVRSTDAPLKNPDPSSEEGQAEIQAYMDSLHGLFVEAIATGRGTSASKVNSGYGRGADFLASQALERGMIDSIKGQKPALRVVSNSTTKAGSSAQGDSMDLKTLKAQHPEIFEEVLAMGVAQEKERVSAHIEMGKSLNAQAVAIEAIVAGARVDHQPTLAKYFAVSRNNKDIEARVEDDKAVQAAVQNAAPAANRDLGDLLAESILGEVK